LFETTELGVDCMELASGKLATATLGVAGCLDSRTASGHFGNATTEQELAMDLDDIWFHLPNDIQLTEDFMPSPSAGAAPDTEFGPDIVADSQEVMMNSCRQLVADAAACQGSAQHRGQQLFGQQSVECSAANMHTEGWANSPVSGPAMTTVHSPTTVAAAGICPASAAPANAGQAAAAWGAQEISSDALVAASIQHQLHQLQQQSARLQVQIKMLGKCDKQQ